MALQSGDLFALSRAGTIFKEAISTLVSFVLASPVATGVLFEAQPAPTTGKNGVGTLTIAELLTKIVQTGGTAFALTLPTGTLSDAGVLAGALPINTGFRWSLISGSSGIVTLGAGTGHTIVGTATTPAAGQSRWFTRKTAANTFITYRIG